MKRVRSRSLDAPLPMRRASSTDSLLAKFNFRVLDNGDGDDDDDGGHHDPTNCEEGGKMVDVSRETLPFPQELNSLRELLRKLKIVARVSRLKRMTAFQLYKHGSWLQPQLHENFMSTAQLMCPRVQETLHDLSAW